jgi:serine/threonine protein kinase
VTKDFTVKLADLGEARDAESLRSSDMAPMPQNINWSPPEVLSDAEVSFITHSSDVWSLSVVVAEIVSGNVPFDSSECRQLSVEAFVEALVGGMRPELPEKTEDWLVQMLREGWDNDPAKRCSSNHMKELFDNHIDR